MRSFTLGRFLQRDPIGYADGMNSYSYVHNSPTNFIDPWGNKKIKVPDGPYFVHPNDADPFPSNPHAHVGSPNSKIKVNLFTGEIFNGAKKTGIKVAKDVSF